MSYEFLKTITAPRHMVVAASLIGTKEIPGGKSNPIIMEWAKKLGLDKIYTNDDTAWCGLFYANVMSEAGRPVVLETRDKWDYLRALKYATCFEKVELDSVRFGDTLIFNRPGGAHIGFCVGEDKDCFHVLGGNQSNMVNVIRILKKRAVHARRPKYISYQPPQNLLSAAGKVSSNEA